MSKSEIRGYFLDKLIRFKGLKETKEYFTATIDSQYDITSFKTDFENTNYGMNMLEHGKNF